MTKYSDYRADPVSQRDGSPLANSNCRMASIATGLDFDTLGKKTSTGAEMRTHTSDQSGGTDAGDAKEAWWDGYRESLDIQDGNTFDQLITDLKAGRMVHIDVWHATVGGPCLSGSGAYGHTMAVAPEESDGRWLVADPWCKPAKWVWVEERKLRAGAEEWGRRVFHRATQGVGRRTVTRAEFTSAAKLLMDVYHAGGPEDPSPDPEPSDTGGQQAILYTATTGHPGGSLAMSIVWRLEEWDLPAGTPFYSAPGGEKIGDLSKASTVRTLGPLLDPNDADGINYAWRALLIRTAAVDGTTANKVVWMKRPSGLDSRSAAGWAEATWKAANDISFTEYPPPVGNCDAAIASRDEQWRGWLLAGSPGEEG